MATVMTSFFSGWWSGPASKPLPKGLSLRDVPTCIVDDPKQLVEARSNLRPVQTRVAGKECVLREVWMLQHESDGLGEEEEEFVYLSVRPFGDADAVGADANGAANLVVAAEKDASADGAAEVAIEVERSAQPAGVVANSCVEEDPVIDGPPADVMSSAGVAIEAERSAQPTGVVTNPCGEQEPVGNEPSTNPSSSAETLVQV
jgi:hypothetical protein